MQQNNKNSIEESKESAHTRTFDSLASEESRKSEEKKDTGKRIAKASAKTFGYIMMKIVTYLLNILLTVLLVGLVTGAVVAIAFASYIKNYIDPNYNGLDNLKFDSSLSTRMFYVNDSGDEVELTEDMLSSSENRLWAEYSTIPKNLRNAYIAVEDKRFWEHNGVDTQRTASAILNFFIPTSSSYGGGSTITQQLIKNVSGENETTIQRKVQEIFRAVNIEEKFSKNEILEMYLNTIYLSHNSYGVRSAADTYFGKELSELTLSECAALASIGKWPIHYDPIVNPKNNLERRNLVLKLMLEQELISQEEYYEAYDSPLSLDFEDNDVEYTETVHSYYIDAVMDDVIADLMEKYGYDATTASRVLYSGGLEIVTCLNPAIQNIMETVYTDESYWPATKGILAQSAMCIEDPKTGDLLGIVGGRGEKKVSRGLNRATQSKRQCGSSIKPVSAYALALETGLYSYAGPVDDIPPVYYAESERFWPRNSGGVYSGRSSLVNAIQRSMNTIAVSTILKLGEQRAYDNMLASGFTTLVDSLVYDDGSSFTDISVSPLALGSFTFGVTVREMTQAYTTFANYGVTSKARTYSIVRDSTGGILLDNQSEHEVLYRESTAYTLTRLLEQVIKGSAGTARSSISFYKKYGVEIAGKTGTTNDSKDLYFCGYTPDLCGACWYGYDNNKTITSSGSSAALMFNQVFNLIYKYYTDNGIEYTKTFYQPASVVTNVEYCIVSGKLATEACKKDLYTLMGGPSSVLTDGVFDKDFVPTEQCDMHTMVKWDQVTKAVCMPGCNCPAENLIDVGMRVLKLGDRLFDKQVRISDAQYVYMEVPQGYVYPTDINVPFFQNIIPEGKFVGYTDDEAPYNRICIEHYAAEVTPEVTP